MTEKIGKIVAASIGDCVHVAGVTRFLAIAEEQGYETYFTGPATDLETFADAIVARQPDVIAQHLGQSFGFMEDVKDSFEFSLPYKRAAQIES